MNLVNPAPFNRQVLRTWQVIKIDFYLSNKINYLILLFLYK